MTNNTKLKIIPPLSVVRVASDRPEWRTEAGRTFRIGYYRETDGLDCVWLVNDSGQYEQTTDQRSIETDFTVIQMSDETDMFGTNRPIIPPLNSA